MYFVDLNQDPQITPEARCLQASYNGSVKNRKGEDTGVLHIKSGTQKGYQEAMPGDSVNLSYVNQNQRRGRVGKGIANTLDTGNQQGVVTLTGRIRRLMPRECFRLQGFTDSQIDKLLDGSSDTQAYKQAETL